MLNPTQSQERDEEITAFHHLIETTPPYASIAAIKRDGKIYEFEVQMRVRLTDLTEQARGAKPPA